MKFNILTLFPDMFNLLKSESIIGRAVKEDRIKINTVNIRDFANNKHNRVDDYPYGGGAGMLMQAQPIYDAYSSLNLNKDVPVIYMSPQGKSLTQSVAKEFSTYSELVILCGHYEGVDERIVEEIVTHEISIGDYVLTGGELPAMVFIDTVSRLVDGVIAKESTEEETFSNGLIEYPQYTRPEIFMGREVPEVLLSGHHENIRKWRQEESINRTKMKRSDLL